MTKRDQILLASLVLSGLGLWLIGQVHAQPAERAEDRTKQWTIPITKNAYGTVSVHVLDTSGVCLYVVRDSTGMNENNSAIAAVQKTQLPPGTGCQ